VFARVASFSGGSTEKLREVNEEAMSSGTMELPPGLSKAMVLSNEAGDRRLFITFFDDRASLDAAEEQFDRMGDDIAEDVRGKRTAVEVYEVVFER
jgi:hypothetical protein